MRRPIRPHGRRAGAFGAALVLVVTLGTVSMATPAGAEPLDPTGVLRFDFGCEGSPVAADHLQVADTTVYDADRGYGLSQTVDCRDRGEPDAVRQDFTNGADYHFLADLPDGEYHITIISGDQIASNNTNVSVQGVDQGQMQPRGAGEFSAHELFTTVTDGQLDVHFRNDGRANGIIVSQVFAPTGLHAADVGLAPPSVTVAWDAMDSAESYTVYRSPVDEDDFAAVDSTSDTSLTDGNVDLGYSYDYAVTQTNTGGIESALSDPVSVSVTDPSVAPPATPSNLTLQQANRPRTIFTWDAVPDSLQYHVFRGLSENGPFERVAVGEETSYTHHGAAPVNYYYYVVAVNEGGLSAQSELLLTPITTKPVGGGDAPKGCGNGPFDAQVLKTGQSWRSLNGGTTVYNGFSMRDAMQAAVDSLTPGRTSQERVIVRGSGIIPADHSVDLPSHTSFEVCGTIDVTGNESSFDYDNHNAPVRIRHAEDVSVPYLNVTGNPNFGVFVRTSEDIHLGQLDLRLRGGHGVRIDSRDDDSVRAVRNVSIDDVYVSGTESHGVETYGVDGINIGTVTAVDTGFAGVLLNDTINADIDLVEGDGAGTGTGYAAFRTANRNGQIDGAYPINIRVGEVIARGGGRGIFCVSESGGVLIERVDIAGSGSNAVLIENCHNIILASEGGVIEGPGDVRIAARSEFANTSDIVLENFTLRDSAINENPCGENITIRNITLDNSQINAC